MRRVNAYTRISSLGIKVTCMLLKVFLTFLLIKLERFLIAASDSEQHPNLVLCRD